MIITSDGQIHKSDDAQSRNNVLAQVDPDNAEAAVRYFQKRFSDLEKYVDASLRIIDGNPIDAEFQQLVDRLREEIASAKVVGNLEVLMGKVNAAVEGVEKSTNDTGGKTKEQSGDLTEGLAGETSAQETGKTAEHRTAPAAADLESKPELKPESESEAEPEQETEAEAELDPDLESKPELKPEQESEAEPDPESGTTDQKIVFENGDKAEIWAELRTLADKASNLAKEADWQYVQNELENIRYKWNEQISGNESLTSYEIYAVLLKQREEAEKKFLERKAAYQEKRRERKKENVDRRAKILDQLQNVIEKKRWQAFKEVNSLTNRWEEIRDLPNEDTVKEQDKKFQQYVDEFNEKKVGYLIKKAQKEEENLAGKLAVIDKLDQLVKSIGSETANWDLLDSDIEELSRQWKKIGHVPMEQSDTIWERFKSIRDEYFDKKFEFNKAFRKITTKNIQRKTRLCEKSEALLEEKDLALAIREINLLHNRWKKTGPIPKKKNEELWERFNTATKKFNELKSDNQDTIRHQEQENLNKKVALCEKAEAMKENTNWDEVSLEMDALMKTWKEIGPVPRRKSGKLWRRFKNALDVFFNNRRDHFRNIRTEQKQNYDKKREIVAELEKLGDHEDSAEAVTLAKELQEQYRNIGFVPIKKKSKIASDYKKACDHIYQRARSESKGSTSESSRGSSKADGDKAIRSEHFKLKKECEKIHEEIMRYQDTITFINPGGQGNELIEEIQRKIDNSQKKLEEKQDKLEDLRREINE